MNGSKMIGWTPSVDNDEVIRLNYSDGTTVVVWRRDFERDFGEIVAMPKEKVTELYAVELPLDE